MKSKILAVGIIVLFLGVSITSAFAFKYNASYKTITIDYYNRINSYQILDDWDINITLDPPYPNGENNWYVSCVNLIITFNSETVKNVYINGIKYTQPMIFCEEGVNLIEITAEDWYGNWIDTISYELPIDYTPPECECHVMYINGTFYIIFSGCDPFSGGNRVEFYIGSGLEETDTEGPYEWSIDWTIADFIFHTTIKCIFYDNAGNKITCYPFPETRDFYGIGFICNLIYSKLYLRFFARYIITSHIGKVKSEYIDFITDDFNGFIGKNFIFAKINGWEIDSEGIIY